jgi:cytochrome c oxidase subunit 3
MSWFIFSEVMFFGAFFGALFWARDLGAVAGSLDHALLWPDFKAGHGGNAAPAGTVGLQTMGPFPSRPSTPRCC